MDKGSQSSTTTFMQSGLKLFSRAIELDKTINMIFTAFILQETSREHLTHHSNYSAIAIKTAQTKETFVKHVANKYYSLLGKTY